MVFKSNFSPNRQFVSCFLKLEATAYYACCTPRVSRSFLSSEHFVLTTTVLDLYSTSVRLVGGKYCDLILPSIVLGNLERGWNLDIFQ